MSKDDAGRAEREAAGRADEVSRLAADLAFLDDPRAPAWSGSAPFEGAGPGALEPLVEGLQTGDVLISRAPALTSAGIGALPLPPSPFSHTSIAWRGPDGVEVLGSFMEHGTVLEPLDQFLVQNKTVRVVVLRHRDPELAQQAGEAAARRVREGPYIPYDDDFDHRDPSTLFCSQLPAWAFGPLIDRPQHLPRHTSWLDHDALGPIYRRLGMRHPSFLAPADYLYDPELEVVAEWRDRAQLRATLLHDAVLAAMLGWARDHGYRLRVHRRDQAYVHLGLAVRRTPVLGRLMAHMVSKEVRPTMLIGALTLQHAGADVIARLEARLGADRIEPARLVEELEAIRVEGGAFERWFR